jgi:hypothetical protein
MYKDVSVEIKSTTNYSQFKTMKGNRKLSESHLSSLVGAIARDNLLKYSPITVNEHMEVVDGQHRLAAAKKLRKEIYYQVLPQSDIDTVVKINTSSKGWSQLDFLESWIDRGNEQYEELKAYMTYNNIPLATAIRLLSWKKSGSSSSTFRYGKFTVNKDNKADLVVAIIKALDETNATLVLYSHKFLLAVMKMVDHDLYDHDRMLKQIAIKPAKLYGSDNVLDFVRQLEDIYNYHFSKSVVRFI